MTAVLISGRSGTDRSTVLAVLARRGHRTADADEDEWSEQVVEAVGRGAATR